MSTTDHSSHDDSQVVVGNGDPFPLKLHTLLDETEERGFSSIISWEGNTAFQVHNKELFTSKVMPSYFDSTNYKTFQRNLNLWGFRTVSKGPRKGECSHSLFVKGKPDLCRSMVRVRIKTNPPERFYRQQQQQQEQETNSVAEVAEVSSTAESAGTTRVNTSLPCIGSRTQAVSTTQHTVATPSSGMPGLGASLATSLKTKQQESAGHQPPVATINGTQSLGFALVSLLENVAGSGNKGSATAATVFPHTQQQQLPFSSQNDLFSALQQHSPILTLNQQLLQLLALQQHLQQTVHTSTGTVPSNPLVPSISGGCAFPATTTNDSAGLVDTLLASPIHGQPTKLQSSETAVTSSSDRTTEDTTSTMAAEKLKSGTKLVACRARGMAMEHNSHTAYFEVTPDMSHGSDLVCSYPLCRNGGVKFLYCKFCDAPIARRSFRTQHLHTGEELPTKSTITISSVSSSNSVDERPPQKRRKTGPNEDVTPTKPSAGVVSNDGYSSSTSSLSNIRIPSSELQQLKRSWDELLEQRSTHKSQEEVSPWLIKVLELSDRYASLWKEENGG